MQTSAYRPNHGGSRSLHDFSALKHIIFSLRQHRRVPMIDIYISNVTLVNNNNNIFDLKYI